MFSFLFLDKEKPQNAYSCPYFWLSIKNPKENDLFIYRLVSCLLHFMALDPWPRTQAHSHTDHTDAIIYSWINLLLSTYITNRFDCKAPVLRCTTSECSFQYSLFSWWIILINTFPFIWFLLFVPICNYSMCLQTSQTYSVIRMQEATIFLAHLNSISVLWDDPIAIIFLWSISESWNWPHRSIALTQQIVFVRVRLLSSRSYCIRHVPRSVANL